MFYDKYIALCNSIEKSPSAVAQEIGFNRASVTLWKKGGGATDSSLQKIADYFHVSVDYFLDTAAKKETPTAVVSELDTLAPDKARLLAAYDRADEKSRALVRLALGLD